MGAGPDAQQIAVRLAEATPGRMRDGSVGAIDRTCAANRVGASPIGSLGDGFAGLVRRAMADLIQIKVATAGRAVPTDAVNMMIKNVLVSLSRSHFNEAAVRAALALAQVHDARLTAVVSDECTAAVGPILATQVGEGTAATGGSGAVAVRSPSGPGRRPRRVDLAVIGGAHSRRYLFDPEVAFRDVLARSRCSVLVVPPERMPAAFRRMAMLWERDAHQARATADSMALLSPGAVVDLLAFVPRDMAHWADEDAFVETLVAFARSGFRVRPNLVRAADGDRPDAILGFAVERQVDLLVIPSRRGRRVDPQARSALTAAVFRRALAPVLFAR